MVGKYGKSSFFPEAIEIFDNSSSTNNPDFSQRQVCVDFQEIRLIAPEVLQRTDEAAWIRNGYSISEEARQAYELADDIDSRKKAGLDISVRFPCSRKSLWDSEPQGLPIHLTHVLSIPSLFFTKRLIFSLHEKLESSQCLHGDWVLVGKVREIDHQLQCNGSITRSNIQIVFDRFEESDHWKNLKHEAQDEFCARLTSTDWLDFAGERPYDERSCDTSKLFQTMTRICCPAPVGDRRASERVLAQRLACRAGAWPTKYLCISVQCAWQDSQLGLTAELTSPCESYVVTPLKLLKVIPTALSAALLRRAAGAPSARGLLSMDQARRLLVLGEEDPVATRLPLVGLWAAGPPSPADAGVWAAVGRFRHAVGLGERVTQGGGFLLLLFPPAAAPQPPQLFQAPPPPTRPCEGL